MALTPVKCPSCGAGIELDDAQEAAPCPNCGVRIIFKAAQAFHQLDQEADQAAAIEAKLRRGIETQSPGYFYEVLDLDPDNMIARRNLALLRYTGLIDKRHDEEWLITRYIKNSIYYRPIQWSVSFSRGFFGDHWKLMTLNALTRKISELELNLDAFFDFIYFKDLPETDQREIIETASGEWFFFIHDNQKHSYHKEIRDMPDVNETCQAILLLCKAFHAAGYLSGERVGLFAFYVRALSDQILQVYAEKEGACAFLAEEMRAMVLEIDSAPADVLSEDSQDDRSSTTL
ncbi:MAG: hypothetical protein LBT44_07045 [Clostridiales bacterium]|jgi:DNA-directed RNA polymerase subunit RPC12/RpoP|nr:hypothetical protein [Clostridiales bacterium]